MADYFNKYIGSYISSIGKIFTKSSSTSSKVAQNVVQQCTCKIENIGFAHLPNSSKLLLRFAGASGVLSIILAAYGAHNLNKKQTNKELTDIYYIAQNYHLMHSIALLGVPLVKRPIVTGSLFVSGMLLFCGTMYYRAFTQDESLKMLTPFGGYCFIAGWLSILL